MIDQLLRLTLNPLEECIRDYNDNIDTILSHPRFNKNKVVRWASEYGHLEVVKYLVSIGADIRASKDYSIVWASKNDHIEVVKYLVSLGADCNCAVKHITRNNGSFAILKYLFDHCN